MPWINVELDVEGKAVPNVVQISNIVRIGPRSNGSSYMKLVDGSTIELIDTMEELSQVFLKAESK